MTFFKNQLPSELLLLQLSKSGNEATRLLYGRAFLAEFDESDLNHFVSFGDEAGNNEGISRRLFIVKSGNGFISVFCCSDDNGIHIVPPSFASIPPCIFFIIGINIVKIWNHFIYCTINFFFIGFL